jgi:orotidine-5'-phosphate decarboxylase
VKYPKSWVAKIVNKDKIIVALDVPKEIQAKEIISQLKNEVGGFKIGLQLFTAVGGTFVREMARARVKIFLDLKYHDIPNTVAKAAVEAARLGVWMFNVHTFGGSEMMLRAVDEMRDVCEKERILHPKIIGVTVLTSSNDETLKEVGVRDKTTDQVLKLAHLASKCGLDGIVVSPLEVKMIRGEIENKRFLIVTPGIRSPETLKNSTFDTPDDQKRTLTAGEAIAYGADYIVVGRPILKSKNPVSVVREILADIEKKQGKKNDGKILEFSKQKS